MIEAMNVACWVKRWAQLYPEKKAIYFEKREISYSELNARVNSAVCWLQSVGVVRGSRVAVMLENCPEFIEIYLACARMGAIFVPVNGRLVAPELQYIVNNCKPSLFVFGENFDEIVSTLSSMGIDDSVVFVMVRNTEKDYSVLDYRSGVSGFVGKMPEFCESFSKIHPEDPQVIMYTSGTTGAPKGAVLSYRKTFFNCLNAEDFFRLYFDDVMLIMLPLFHSGALFIQASPTIYKGGTMIIHRRFDSNEVYKDIERYKVTKLSGVPTIFRVLVKTEKGKLGDICSLKTCAIGGEKTTPELLMKCKDAGFYVRQIMGQTETSILLWATEEESLIKQGTVGRPVFHGEVSIMDENDCAVGVREIGEIAVRGSIMMTEYWNDTKKTEETIRGGWLHTGDLAYRDEDGFFYLVDRVKDMYISGGENVYPTEVERILRKHPGIEDIAIVGVADDTWGEVGHAFIIKGPGHEIDERDVIDFCRGRLAKFKWPRKVTFVKSFPCTSLGKVKKYELRQHS